MMGLAGAKRNKCRRLLTPIEIEGQRHNEDRVNNPSLLLWYDFTDQNTLLKVNTASDQPSHGDGVWQVDNKVVAQTYVGGNIITSPYPWESIGEKGLGRVVNCPPGNAPTYVDGPTLGLLHNGLLFDGTNSFIFGSGSTGPTSGSNFSTSELEFPGITMFIVCERIDTGSARTSDVFSIYDNSGSRALIANFDTNNKFGVELIDGSIGGGTSSSVRYTTADDADGHYHAYNSYDDTLNVTTFTTLDADGFMNGWLSGGSTYSRFGATGTFATTFEFAGLSNNNFVCFGGRRDLTRTDGVKVNTRFSGVIHEVLVWGHDLAGGIVSADDGYDRNTMRDMLNYLHRKYKYIDNKD
jgi:hypothetical protein